MNDLPIIRRVPGDLPQRIVKNSERLRKFETRHYRRDVAHTTMRLMAEIAAETAKQNANAERARGRKRTAQ